MDGVFLMEPKELQQTLNIPRAVAGRYKRLGKKNET